MNVAFRTDSSFNIGTGHIHRCLNLARKFKKKKIKCYFFSKELPGNINKLVSDEFKLFKISVEDKKNYFSNKSNIKDADLTIKLIKKLNIKLIFLDNYSLDEKWEKKITKYCKLVLISDLPNRKSYCNYYINCNLLYENIILKKNLSNNCRKLIGPDYSIIKDLPKLSKKKIKNKITVFMGGADSKNYTTKLIQILSSKVFLNFEKIIIVGTRNQYIDKLKRQCDNKNNFKIIIGNKKNLYKYFNESKLVITGLGTSMYEHLVLGVNSIVIAQNSIHKKIIKNLSLYNLINFIDKKKDINKNYILKNLNKKNLDKKLKILQETFDSVGSTRIVDYFISKSIFYKAKLKKISFNDRLFFFKLIKNSNAMNNYFKNKIINFNKFEKWFKKILNKDNSKIFIFKSAKHKFGLIRFEKKSKNKTIMLLSVSNEFKGKIVYHKMIQSVFKNKLFQIPLFTEIKTTDESAKEIINEVCFKVVKNHKQFN